MNSARYKFWAAIFAFGLLPILSVPIQAQFGPDSAGVSPFVPAFDQPINADQYLIRPGEKLVVVFLSTKLPDLNLEVNFEGCVVDGNLGVFSLSGKSLSQARQVLADPLRKLYHADDMVISIGSIYPIAIQVSGRVNRPGIYTGFTSQRVSELIDSAGGIAPGGSSRNIALHGGPESVSVDLDRAAQSGDQKFDPCLYAGNRILVRAMNSAPVTIVGEVNQPGAVELLPGESLSQAIELAGGLTADADLASAFIDHFPERDLSQVGSIEPGDRVVIPAVSTTEGVEVIVTGLAGRVGRHLKSDQNQPTLSAFLQSIGGVSASANPDRITVFRQALDPLLETGTDARYPLWIDPTGESELVLRNRDSIHVPGQLFHVELSGAVARPGRYPYQPGATVAQYLTVAGGFADEQTEHTIEIFDRVSGLSRSGTERSVPYDGDRITIRGLGEER